MFFIQMPASSSKGGFESHAAKLQRSCTVLKGGLSGRR